MFTQKIALIGSGNVAWHLAKTFTQKNICVSEIYSRNIKNAQSIIEICNAKYCADIKMIGQNSDIIILCVSDDAIEPLTKQLHCKNKIICHTSGIARTDTLAVVSANYGCFYPLQSFTKHIDTDFSQIPICIFAANKHTQETLQTLAHLISLKVEVLSDKQRQKLHLAAVIVNNFTNHLFTLSSQYLNKNHIDFDLLKPLIQETVNKISLNEPMQNQTGPAKRKDHQTIKKHFNLIEEPDLLEIYKILTKSIQKTYNA